MPQHKSLAGVVGVSFGLVGFSVTAEGEVLPIDIGAALKVDLMQWQQRQAHDLAAIPHIEVGIDVDLGSVWSWQGWASYAELLLDWGGRPNELSLGTLRYSA